MTNNNNEQAPIVKGVYLPLTNLPVVGNVKSMPLDPPVGQLYYMDAVGLDHEATTDPEYLGTSKLIKDAMQGKYGKEVEVSRYKLDRMLTEHLRIPHDEYTLFGDHIDMPILKVRFVDADGNSATFVPKKSTEFKRQSPSIIDDVIKSQTKALSDSINKKLIQLISKKNP